MVTASVCHQNIDLLFSTFTNSTTMSEGPVVEVLSFPVKPDSQAAFQKVWRHFQHVSGFLGGFWAYQVAGESADGNQTAFAFLST